MRSVRRDENATSAIPGVISTYPNSHVTSMKTSPWPEVLALVGKQGERVMVDLILDCGIFLPVEAGRGSYYQLSGQSITPGFVAVLMIKTGEPLGDLPNVLRNVRTPLVQGCGLRARESITNKSNVIYPPAGITFVRNRMLYARAALNAQHEIRFGLRHIRMFATPNSFT